jgi:hypothetical protein
MRMKDLLLLSAGLGLLASAFAFPPHLETELLIQVRLPDGTPAKGVKVQQIQLERTSPLPQNYMCGVTNSDGELSIRFASMQSQGDDRNGFGLYRFVLMPENLRWELSDMYYWNKDPWTDQVFMEANIWSSDVYREQMKSPENAHTNWSFGGMVRMTASARHYWQVQLQTGSEARMLVEDQNGRPLANKNFSVFLDAGVLSHTGFGGEIPISSLQTDDRGLVNLLHAGTFWYSFKLAGTDEYCRPDVQFFDTVVTGRAIDNAGVIRYFKRIPRSVRILVRDKATQAAIAGADISELISFSFMTQGGPIGKTGSDGSFATDRLLTEHVLQLVAAKDGYEDYKFDMKGFVSGSTYTFEMTSKK